jgi:peptide alpha-N-acetyltransferase
MRDIQGFVETRYRLLQLRPNNRNNWVTWAVAHHLDGNHDMAVQILRGYESTVVGACTPTPTCTPSHH